MLVTRIISAVIGAILLILLVISGGWMFNLAIIVLSILGLNELYGAFKNSGVKVLPAIGMGAAVIMNLLIIYQNEVYINILLIFILILSMCMVIFFKRTNITGVIITLFGLIYPVLPLTYLIAIRSNINENHLLFLSLVFICTWMTDTCAYFVGINFGKHKLCPKISPKKSIEGSIGGLLGSMLISLLVYIFVNIYYNKIDIVWYNYLLIGLLCGIFSQLGDLSASIIKRHCNIKDFGRLFPGHGGLLDRFDSILFTVPVVYIYIILFIQ